LFQISSDSFSFFSVWVGLKCEAGPSLYVKKTPSRLVLGSTLFKICCCLTFILLPEGREIHECAGLKGKRDGKEGRMLISTFQYFFQFIDFYFSIFNFLFLSPNMMKFR